VRTISAFWPIVQNSNVFTSPVLVSMSAAPWPDIPGCIVIVAASWSDVVFVSLQCVGT
jgi:hypothetical protein